MNTRCVCCQTLNNVMQECCSSCGAVLTFYEGVNESEHWNGKVRSQHRDDPIRKDCKTLRDKLSDWIERDSTQVKVIVLGFVVVCVIMGVYLLAAIGIA